jgi:DNA-binding NarL/FixJ family response regulator
MTRLLPDINIVIADDHELFRDGLKLLPLKYPEIHIVGEAQNGLELIELTRLHNPEIILTDIKMPVMDGIEAARKITALNKDVGIIGLSMFDEDELIIDMLEAGAKGYLLKNCDKQELIEAITTVYHGNCFYCKNTSKKLIDMIAKSKFNPYKKKAKPEFSERETEIIQLICDGLSSKEIGDKLYISDRTVEGHRHRIMEKMDVSNIAGLIVYALKNGICKLY